MAVHRPFSSGFRFEIQGCQAASRPLFAAPAKKGPQAPFCYLKEMIKARLSFESAL